MSIQRQLAGRYYDLADKAQTLPQLQAAQQRITGAIQDDVLKPYEGVPLVQDLTARIQKAQQAQQAQMMQQYAPQPQGIPQGQAPAPIASQIMAQAQQTSGVSQLPSNLPAEEGYAAGGIIAFADGGDAEEDDSYTEDDREEANLMSLMDMARAKIRSGIGAVRGALPQSYERTLAAQPPTAPATVNTQDGLSGLLGRAAAKHSLPQELLQRIAGSESGGNANAANPKSSAKGIFQFTDSTWRSMGGREGEQFNPEINTELGAKYVRQNAEGLKNALGRNPTYGEVYASHFFGLQGAKDLLNMNPKTPMNQAVSSQVIKANPNLRGKTVGEVLGTLRSKMGEGIVSLAQGGAIKHFAKAGEVESSTENPYAMMGDIGASAKDYTETNILDNLRKKFNIKTAKEAEGEERLASLTDADRARFAATQEMEDQEANKPAVIPIPPTVIPAATPPVPPQGIPGATQAAQPEAVDPYLQKYMEMLQGRETESAKQKETDKYLALLQAGLGMMGGTSPYAMVNIGQGATQGVGALMAANKQRAVEDAATLGGYGKLYTAKQAADLKRELTTSGREDREDRFRREEATKITTQISNRERQIENQVSGTLQKLMGKSLETAPPEEQARIINAAIQKAKADDNVLRDLYNKSGLAPIENIVTPNYVQSAEDRLKKLRDRGIQ